jgi:hypothetical protein
MICASANDTHRPFGSNVRLYEGPIYGVCGRPARMGSISENGPNHSFHSVFAPFRYRRVSSNLAIQPKNSVVFSEAARRYAYTGSQLRVTRDNMRRASLVCNYCSVITDAKPRLTTFIQNKHYASHFPQRRYRDASTANRILAFRLFHSRTDHSY